MKNNTNKERGNIQIMRIKKRERKRETTNYELLQIETTNYELYTRNKYKMRTSNKNWKKIYHEKEQET